MNSADDFAQGIELVPGRWSFVWVKRPDSARTSQIAAANICYCIDDELLYEPFFADFGPLNLGRTYRFCKKTQELLQEAERSKKKLFLWTGPSAHHKANAAVLVGIFQVLYLQRSAEEALKPLLAMKPYVPFRDASCGVSTFHLTVMDCIKGIQKARDVGFIDWNSGSSTWSVDEYEHFEQVENGDLNWIVPGKLVAFSGPAARGNEIAGYRLLTPEDYWDYYRRKGVTTVVRLNKKVYDRRRFTDGGFKHVDLYFPDGSCPTDAILHRFLDIAENEPGALAVHCKAGLGRTGVLICCYIMKHYRFTAEEVIGYIRVCRPGSVIGPQQNFIREMEARMWHEGEIYRQQKGLAPKAALLSQDLTVNGKMAPSVDPVDSPYVAKVHAAVNGHYASGHAGGYGHVPAAHTPLTRHNSGGQQLRPQELMIGNSSSGQGPAAQAHTPASDLSLVQYKMQYGMPGSGPGNGSVSASAASSNGMYGMANVSPSGSPTGAGAVSHQALGNGVGSSRNRYSHRSITPLRYGISSQSAGAAGNGYSGSSNGLSSAYGVSASYPSSPTGASRQSILSSAVPGASVASAVSRSMPVMPARSPSADRASGRLNSTGGSGASLRATLHTDTVQAADRPKVLPERNMQSADAGSSGGWRLSASPSSPALGAAAAASRSSSTGRAAGNGTGIARVLAPNGQPRKVPVSMLHQYSAPAPLSAMAHQGLLPSGRPSSIAIGASDAGRMKAAGVQQLRYALHSK